MWLQGETEGTLEQEEDSSSIAQPRRAYDDIDTETEAASGTSQTADAPKTAKLKVQTV